MQVNRRTAIVTGAASGIGAALARELASRGAHVAVGDVDEPGVAALAAEVGGIGQRCDVSVESDIVDLVERTRGEYGPIDLFFSNAGIAIGGDPWVSDEDWDRIWRINVLSHIYAARAVLPEMLERGTGHLVQTSSAAGLLTQIGSAPYAVTKHAVVAFAEYLAVTYGAKGIDVSVLAPQAVDTAMARGTGELFGVAAVDGMMSADEVAAITVDGVEAGRFLILPHPEVETYVQRKAADPERWIKGMQRFQESLGL